MRQTVQITGQVSHLALPMSVRVKVLVQRTPKVCRRRLSSATLTAQTTRKVRSCQGCIVISGAVVAYTQCGIKLIGLIDHLTHITKFAFIGVMAPRFKRKEAFALMDLERFKHDKTTLS